MDVVLVSLIAPVVNMGGSRPALKGIQRYLAKIPSAVFAPNVPGVMMYPIPNRLASLVVKFGEYSLAGITCGFLGQTLANTAINAR
eukprot:gene22102-29160_t